MINIYVKNAILNVPLLSNVYATIRQEYIKCRLYQRCALLRKFGPEVIRKVHSTLERSSLPYFANGGTLLGVVREHDFIRHDDDIDYNVLAPHKNAAEYCRALLGVDGFSFKRAFEINGRIKQLVFSYKGIDVDFFFMHKEGGVLYNQLYDRFQDVQYKSSSEWSTIRYVFPPISGTKEVPFAGGKICIPVNAEEVLTAVYGCWKTPIRNFGGPQWEQDFGQARRVILPEKALVVGLDRVWELASNASENQKLWY